MINKIRLSKLRPLENGTDAQKIKALEDYIEILCRELEYLLTQLSRGE